MSIKKREDFEWLNDDSTLFLKRGYLLEGTEPKDRIKYIADYAEKKLGIDGFSDKFYHYMARGYYSLSSPVWSNYGLQRGAGISCFGSPITDSVEGIMDTLAEVGMMGKIGGGTSAYFGKIRPRGAPIKDNGVSDGSFNFARLFDNLIDVISQGTSRRSQFAAYIDIDHPDIHEWLNIHTEGNPIQLMYYGVCVGNDWLEEMKNGDSEKRAIWAKVLQRRSETGIPYIFFKDNVNNGKPEVYKDKNMVIYNSNLCVSGDTTILTKEYGHTYIKDHVGERVTVWNGEEWSSNVELIKTGEDKELYRVELSNGSYINATGYHKWYVIGGGSVLEKRTLDLIISDTLESWVTPEGDKQEGITITNVEKLHDTFDTYCCNEPKRHKVIFNGIMTGNCNEISLPISDDESFICCLSSMNILHYDEWKDTDAVETLTYFLDTVLDDFIEKASKIKHMERAVKFAKRHRAIGVGVLGWHSYLQSKMIPFNSFEAMQHNNEIFKLIKEKTYKASAELAQMFGEPEILEGYGRRNTTTMSVPPTKSSSFILGSVSPSIEPFKSNYYVKDLAKIKTTYKNPFLEKLLKEKNKDTKEVWDSILVNDGSVQHLDFLTDHEKDVFKTFPEISQLTIIQQAAQRQKYIDQGQSLNVMIHPDTPTKDINQLYLTAAELGIKGLYYQFSMSAAQKFNRELLNGCASCEG